MSPPKRLADEKVRGESVLGFSLRLFGLEVERESLLVLQAQVRCSLPRRSSVALL